MIFEGELSKETKEAEKREKKQTLWIFKDKKRKTCTSGRESGEKKTWITAGKRDDSI